MNEHFWVKGFLVTNGKRTILLPDRPEEETLVSLSPANGIEVKRVTVSGDLIKERVMETTTIRAEVD